MLGFKKKKQKALLIKAKDVFSIIKSDYDNDMEFYLIEFICNNNTYTMGSPAIPDRKKGKENIFFIFNDEKYSTYEDFANNVIIDGFRLSDSDIIIEITRAGIIDGEEMITPWGDTRLKKHALN